MAVFSLFQESSTPQPTAASVPSRTDHGQAAEEILPPVKTLPPPTELETQTATSALLSARAWGLRNDAQGKKLIDALLGMSEIRHRQGDAPRATSLLNEAMHRFQEFIQVDSEVGQKLYRALGKFSEAQGRPAEALEHYQVALQHAAKLPPRLSDTTGLHETVANCCQRLGDFVHAEEYRRLAGPPSDPTPAPRVSAEIPAILPATPEEFLLLPNRQGHTQRWSVTHHRAESTEILTADF
jgi:tetratricopeptide (TPR) repeat protein